MGLILELDLVYIKTSLIYYQRINLNLALIPDFAFQVIPENWSLSCEAFIKMSIMLQETKNRKMLDHFVANFYRLPFLLFV